MGPIQQKCPWAKREKWCGCVDCACIKERQAEEEANEIEKAMKKWLAEHPESVAKAKAKLAKE